MECTSLHVVVGALLICDDDDDDDEMKMMKSSHRNTIKPDSSLKRAPYDYENVQVGMGPLQLMSVFVQCMLTVSIGLLEDHQRSFTDDLLRSHCIYRSIWSIVPTTRGDDACYGFGV